MILSLQPDMHYLNIYALQQKYFLAKDDMVCSVYRSYIILNDTEFGDRLRDVFIEYDQIGVEFRQAFLYMMKGNYVRLFSHQSYNNNKLEKIIDLDITLEYSFKFIKHKDINLKQFEKLIEQLSVITSNTKIEKKDYISDAEQENIVIIDAPTFPYDKSSIFLNNGNQLVTNMRYANELLNIRPSISPDTSVKKIEYNKFVNLRKGVDSKVQATLLDLGSGAAKWLKDKFSDNRRLFIFIDTVESESFNPDLFINNIYDETTKNEILRKISDLVVDRITTMKPDKEGKFNILLISDIRTPFPSAQKTLQKKKWEESIKKDHTTQADFIYSMTKIILQRINIVQLTDITGKPIKEKNIEITSH